MLTMTLLLLRPAFGIARLGPSDRVPHWAGGGSFVSVTRSVDELSVVCEEAAIPAGVTAERGWRCLRVAGTLDFALTGVLAALATPLAEAGVSIFAVSTFDTDYVLVRAIDLGRALEGLRRAGHTVQLPA
jgi:hypothetical protein